METAIDQEERQEADWDGIMTEKGRITEVERLKARKVDDLVQMIMDINVKSQIDKKIAKDLQTEKDITEEKLKVTVNKLKTTQNKLKEEKEITADLRLRLKNNTKKVLLCEKPSVIVITDRNSGDICESLDCDNIKLELKLIETLDKLKGGMDKNMITYLIKFDLVMIMLGRNDIQSGKYFIKLSEDIEEVITLISDLGVEVRPIQILHFKGAKYRTDIRFFNEGIIDTYSGKSICLDNIFRKMNDQEMFIRAKTTVKVELLQKVKDEIVAQTGTPDIRDKTQPPVPAPGAISQKSQVEISENTDVTNDDDIFTPASSLVSKEKLSGIFRPYQEQKYK